MHRTLARHFSLALVTMAPLTAMCITAQTPAILQGNAALGNGDIDLAIRLLEQAVAQFPNDAETHYHLANAYGAKAEKSGMLAAARYAPKARAGWERAVTLNPNHVEARFSLVEFYVFAPGFMGGSYDKAFEQAKAIKGFDPILGHRAYGTIYLQQKKLDLAKKEYLDAIREQPNSAKAYVYLGKYFTDVEKNYPAAFAEFETALKVDPTFMPTFYHLGRTASLANTNHARGEQALKKYLAYIPKVYEPTLANAHYRLGLIYEQGGKKVDAKQSYLAALRLNPSMKEASESLKRLS